MHAPRITVSDFARTRIDQVRASQGKPDAAVRIAITGRSNGQFVYDMQLASPGSEAEGDIVVDLEGVTLHIPLASAVHLDGATVDADRLSGALRVDNPNPLWSDPLAERVQIYLDETVNPMVASHGGHIDLLDVVDGVAVVHMGGGCQGCGMAEVTLSQGVRTSLLERFEELTEVRDATDHAAGANPYYEASKK